MTREHIKMVLDINPHFQVRGVHGVWNNHYTCIINENTGKIIIRLSGYRIGSYNNRIIDAYDPIVQDFCNLLGYNSCSVSSNFNKFVEYLKLHFRKELTLR